MAGGNYSTGFKDDGKLRLRKILYYLESLGITKVKVKKVKDKIDPKIEKVLIEKVRNLSTATKDKYLKKAFSNWKPSLKEYKWILTDKGKKIVENNETLQKLKKEGDILKFFKALKDEVEKKEFFIH